MLYFNTAVMGCLPSSTIDVIEEYTGDLAAFLRGDTGWDGTLQALEDRKPESKKVFAKVIGASEDEVACVPNATAGINTIMNMLPVGRGDNIVTTDLAFPMGAVVVENQRRRGAETRFIKSREGIVDTADFEKAVDDDTAIVYLDHAGWFNGLLFDLKAISDIAHEHGARLVVDATQSIGAVNWNVDRSGVDAAATSTYKWLMGGVWPLSTGFMYVNRELVDAHPPAYVSGASMEKMQIGDSEEGYTRYEFTPQRGIKRLEVFRGTDVSYVAVEHSMKILLKLGLNKVEARIKKLDTMLVDGLIESGFQLQTPEEEDSRIFLNVKNEDPEGIVKRLAEHKIVVSPRVGGIRISPHFYNREDEVDTFLEKLKEVAT